MRKLLIIIITVLLSACSNSVDEETANWNEAVQRYPLLDGVTLKLVQDSYLPSTTVVFPLLINQLDDSFTFGVAFELEYKVSGVWKVVRRNESSVGTEFILIGYTLAPQSETHVRYDLSIYSDELLPGEYRISIDVFRDTINGIEDTSRLKERQFQVYGYFEVE